MKPRKERKTFEKDKKFSQKFLIRAALCEKYNIVYILMKT